jgi:hypothetical protein
MLIDAKQIGTCRCRRLLRLLSQGVEGEDISMVQGRAMDRCERRTDQDESVANESTEFMRNRSKTIRILQSNLVKCSCSTLIQRAKRIEIYVEIRYLGHQ